MKSSIDCSDTNLFHALRKNYRKLVFAWLLACITPVLLAEYGAVTELPKLRLDKPGTINAVVELPDGSLILGGSFSRIDGKERNAIARINPDGSFDDDWDPQIKSGIPKVHALLLSGDYLYVGGQFTSVGGKYRRGICRLDVATGKVDPDWYPVAEGDNSYRSVYALAMTPAGDALFIGGYFNTLGKDIVAIAKVSTLTGDVDASWDPGMASGSLVYTMVLSGSNLFVGGSFTEISGVTRNRLAKLGAGGTGALDMAWNPGADSGVHSLVLSESDGKLYAGGDFRHMGGLSRNGIARVDAAGSGQVDSWNPATVGPVGFIASVRSLALAGTKLYVGGHFAEIGGLARNNIARLNTADATADATWNPDINRWVRVIQTSTDGGSVHVGGDFFKTGAEDSLSFVSVDTSAGQALTGFNNLNVADPGAVLALAKYGNNLYFAGDFVRLNGQPQFFLGKIDTTSGQVLNWGADFDDSILALVVSADGSSLYTGGKFMEIDGMTRMHIARLSSADASVAGGWDPGTTGSVEALLLDGNALYVGGRFYAIGGSSAIHYLAKLAADTGVLDSGWKPSPDRPVLTMALSGTDLYAGGLFNTMGGLPRLRLAKVDAATAAVDPAWVADANNTVRSLLAQGNVLFVGGHFTQLGGVDRNHVAKLDSNGMVDANWNPDASGDVLSFALSDNGNDLYLGGWFNQIGGVARSQVAKLATSTGIVDTEWNPSVVGLHTEVSTLLAGDTGVYAGGRFSEIGGKSTVLGHIVDGHLLSIDASAAGAQARKGIITSVPEGIKCSPATGALACERALVADDYSLTVSSGSPELTVSQEWLSGCDTGGGTSPTCGVTLNANKTVEVRLSCERYEVSPPDEPITGYLIVTCKEIAANRGFEVGNGGRVVFQANSSVELGPGFQVSDSPAYFSIQMQ